MIVINPDDRLAANLAMVHSLKGSIALPVDRDDKTLDRRPLSCSLIP